MYLCEKKKGKSGGLALFGGGDISLVILSQNVMSEE